MLDSGRFRASTALASAPMRPKAFGCPGAIEKSSIWLFSTTPVPGTITFEPYDVLIVGGEDHKTGQADDTDERFDRLEDWARRCCIRE